MFDEIPLSELFLIVTVLYGLYKKMSSSTSYNDTMKKEMDKLAGTIKDTAASEEATNSDNIEENPLKNLIP